MWVHDVEELSEIAVEEPQAALSAYTKGLCHRWSFIQRTIPDIGTLFAPLKQVLKEVFIPALIGRKISDIEREILSLSVRYGGLGIRNPIKVSDWEFKALSKSTPY